MGTLLGEANRSTGTGIIVSSEWDAGNGLHEVHTRSLECSSPNGMLCHKPRPIFLMLFHPLGGVEGLPGRLWRNPFQIKVDTDFRPDLLFDQYKLAPASLVPWLHHIAYLPSRGRSVDDIERPLRSLRGMQTGINVKPSQDILASIRMQRSPRLAAAGEAYFAPFAFNVSPQAQE